MNILVTGANGQLGNEMRIVSQHTTEALKLITSGLLFKLTLAEALEEIATSISKKARLNNEHVFNISLYYFHFINFNRFV
jgi:dTDP-4-dehydrorhamnose reductase